MKGNIASGVFTFLLKVLLKRNFSDESIYSLSQFPQPYALTFKLLFSRVIDLFPMDIFPTRGKNICQVNLAIKLTYYDKT